MKSLKVLALAVLLLLPVTVSGQGKFYTRKARLEDFTAKTTKVVAIGNSLLELNLRAEVTSRWYLSPYEFCTSEDYEKLKNDSNYYFLRFVAEDGIAFLLLEKGGREDDSDRFKRTFEVVRIPIASLGLSSGKDVIYMGAFVEIIQAFTEKAINSDATGYFGLETFNGGSWKGKSIYLNPSDADDAFVECASDVLVPICFAPSEGGQWCYKMVIDAGTHELRYFRKERFRKEKDGTISQSDISLFSSKDALIVR